MKSTERQKFEDSWKEAFEGSEMTPSDSVWSNIDLKLDNEKMKRRVVYYQRLAAAAVLFALLIGVGGVRYFNSTPDHLTMNSDSKVNQSEASSTNATELPEKSIVQEQIKDEENNSVGNKQLPKATLPIENQSKDINGSNENSTAAQNEQTSSIGTILSSGLKNQKKYSNKFFLLDTKKYLPVASQPFENLSYYSSPHLVEGELPDVIDEKKEEPKIESSEIASVLPVESSNEEAEEQKKSREENLWLSFGAATGSYNPGSSVSSVQTANAFTANSTFVNRAAPQSNRSSLGSAYSIGISVGKRIADRWIIQTGVNYLSQAINYTSNFATQSSSNQLKASTADYASLAQDATPVLTQPYKVSSNMEFVSIPVQAGYIIIDRKIGLQLNAGVASDIFLKNTLKDQSGQSGKYSQSSGGESPYRSLNWAGLASTELSYKMSKQYRISLQPGFRYSLQPSLKSQSGTNANPLVLDIGFRFRYIFQ